MSVPDATQSQSGHSVSQPDDNRNYQAGMIWGEIVNAMKSGWNHVVLLKKSLRVGSGAATMAALDGTDGLIAADGTSAGFYGRDRADSTKYFAIYRNGTIRIWSSTTGDLMLIDPTTGLIAPAVTAVAGGIGFANSWANFGNGNNAGYWKDIQGVVHLEGTIAGGALGATAFTLPAGFRPLAPKGAICDANGGAGELTITTGGVVTPVSGSNVYFILDGVSFRTV